MKAFPCVHTAQPIGWSSRIRTCPCLPTTRCCLRVRASSVNPYVWHGMRGEPGIVRLMPGTFGLQAPNFSILGCDMAGQVEAVGSSVSGFRPGDEFSACSRAAHSPST